MLSNPVGTVVREFPSPEVLATIPLESLPMPAGRAKALHELVQLLASGELVLDPGADRDAVSGRLLAIRGVGPWTIAYVRMRALSDPDAFLAGDLGVRRALERLGLPAGESSATALAEPWRPYRAYALQYLWSGLASVAPSDQPRKAPPGAVRSKRQ
jgi:AraC family transcriptional regulator of adaptative response / DNA-3-methyladenine glycosylase II